MPADFQVNLPDARHDAGPDAERYAGPDSGALRDRVPRYRERAASPNGTRTPRTMYDALEGSTSPGAGVPVAHGGLGSGAW